MKGKILKQINNLKITQENKQNLALYHVYTLEGKELYTSSSLEDVENKCKQCTTYVRRGQGTQVQKATKVRTFKTFTDFVVYAKELGNWLLENKYIEWRRPNSFSASRLCLCNLMKDEQQWFADMKAKGLFAKYQEYYNNCKSYLDTHIVVQNRDLNHRYQEFTPSFRFTLKRTFYDNNSFFVWDLHENDKDEWAYKVISPTLYNLPNNSDYYELGICWYPKSIYTLQDIETNKIKEITTPEKIDTFVQSMEKILVKKQPTNVYACIESKTAYEHSNAPGPVRHWTVLIAGWSIEAIGSKYKIESGLASKNRDERMYSSTISCTNREYNIVKKDSIANLIALLGRSDIKKVVVKCDRKEGDTSYICYEKDGVCVIHTIPNKTYDKYFSDFKSVVDDHPYDPSVWGWT